MQRRSKWARGRTEAAGALMGIHGGRRWKRRRRRLHGASGGARLDGEVVDDVAELPDSKRGRGGGGGRGNGVRRRRRVRAVAWERDQGKGRNEREGERCGAARGVVPGRPGRRGGRSRRWPGAWPRPAVARARTCLGEGEKTTEEEAAGPGWPAGPARPHRSWAAGKSPSFISFSIFLTYVLI